MSSQTKSFDLMKRELPAGVLFFTLLVASVYLVGCRDTLDATMRGTVTFQGNPVAYALLNFHPQGKAPMAYDITDENGKYYVSSGTKYGLMPGTYLVEVSPAKPGTIPDRYITINTSGLKVEVKPGKNEFDFALE